MSIVEIIIIAIGLSMDSFAVAVGAGAVMKRMMVSRVIKIAFFLSAFQCVMPLIGFMAGDSFAHHIQSWDHWVAFGLLALMGGKMLQEGFTPPIDEKEKPCGCTDDKKCYPWHTRTLIGLSIATSIDAAAVGISFSFLIVNMVVATIVIFATTVIFSTMGMWVGTRFGRRFRKRAEIIGGVILIAIGIKILIEHLFFS